MSFEDNTIEVIRKEWLIDENNCHFPPTNKYYKYIKKVNAENKLKSWEIYKMVILKQFGEKASKDKIFKMMNVT